MKKTKLLLAFGAHGDLKIEGDSKFFRKAVIPFLEEHVERGKRKAAIICEGTMPEEIPRDKAGPEPVRTVAALYWLMRDREGFLERATEWVAERDKKANSFFMDVADKGLLESGTQGWPNSDFWGFEEYAMGLNRKEPGTVRFLMEPPNIEAIYMDAFRKTISRLLRLTGENLEFVAESMRYSMRSAMLCDKEVLGLTDQLAQEDPDIAIIIPRSRSHMAMEAFFSRDRYDVFVRTGSLGEWSFESDALVRFYAGDLGERELMLYAKLEQELLSYTKSFRLDIVQQDRFPLEVLERVYLEARAYAIAKNQEAAQELGIME